MIFGPFFFFSFCWHISKLRSCILIVLSFQECPRLSGAHWLWISLFFFFSVLQCSACECDLGGSSSGAEVRIRHNQLYCNNCYLRFKCKRANQGENFLSFKKATSSHAFPWTCHHLPLKLPALEGQLLGFLACSTWRVQWMGHSLGF